MRQTLQAMTRTLRQRQAHERNFRVTKIQIDGEHLTLEEFYRLVCVFSLVEKSEPRKAHQG
jgi:hypothetical protein